jgi:phosphopantetheinyl transferase
MRLGSKSDTKTTGFPVLDGQELTDKDGFKATLLLRKHMNVLHAVIRPTPGQDREHSSRERVLHQKVAAREALHEAASRQGIHFPSLDRDEHGAPLPVRGRYWSITHTAEYVAGAAAVWPLGIDIERLRTPSAEVIAEAASPGEIDMVRKLFEVCEVEAFTRIWSAKEALLKLSGEGLAGLSKCTIGSTNLTDTRPGLWIRHDRMEHFVHQMLRDDHIASVTCDQVQQVQWDWHGHLVGARGTR